MFHYPCLLAESGCWECGRCRNSPPFATKCLTRATCRRKCHIAPQSAAFCIFPRNLDRWCYFLSAFRDGGCSDSCKQICPRHASAISLKLSTTPRAEVNHGQSHDRTRGFETTQRQRCVLAPMAATGARAAIPEGWIFGPLPGRGARCLARVAADRRDRHHGTSSVLKDCRTLANNLTLALS
jgi:hypothetical protein